MLIAVGSTVKVPDGRDGVVIAVSGQRLTVKMTDGSFESWLLGEWISVLSEPDDEERSDLEALALAMAPQSEIDRVELIRHHMNEVETGYWHREPHPERPWEPRCRYEPSLPIGDRERAKAKEFLTDSHPALHRRTVSTIRKWRHDLKLHGLAGLVDQRVVRRTATILDADPAVVELVRCQVNQAVNEPTRTFNYFMRQVTKAAKVEGVELPSPSTIRAMQQQISRGVDLFGSAKARRSAASSTGGAIERNDAAFPGEYVEVDSTRVDVEVILPDGGVGRPELTVAIDEYTHTPLSCRVLPFGALSGPDAAAMVAECSAPRAAVPEWKGSTAFHESKALRIGALAPSESPLAEMPPIVALNVGIVDHAACGHGHDAPAAGSSATVNDGSEDQSSLPCIHPHGFVTDNGKAYLSAEVTEACSGVNLYRSRYATGSDKPHIERLFSRLSVLWESMPGYVGRSAEHRGRDDRADGKTRQERRELLYTCEELEAILQTFFAGVWMDTPISGNRIPGHDGDVSPRQKWDHYVATYGEVRVRTSTTAYFSALPTAWRTIQREGIEFNGRKYNSAALNGFRRQNSGRAGDRRPDAHPIKFHPGDVSVIFWLDPATDQWTPIPWVYRNEMTLPFAERSWRHARRDALARVSDANEHQIGQTLERLLTSIEHGPDARTRRLCAQNAVAVEQAHKNRPPINPTDPDTATTPLDTRPPRPAMRRLT